MDSEFQMRLERIARDVHASLDQSLSVSTRPPRLVEAMRYAVFAGGKRMRPFLVMESARLFGVEGDGPMQVATALEAVHCYSLVHDDLPAMDNDDLRRGQPTLHRAFDEATAILAGDALLTLAFSILSDPKTAKSPAKRLKLVAELSKAAGVDGMVGGQMLDLAAEGRFESLNADTAPIMGQNHLQAHEIRRLQALKTGALIEYAVNAGPILALKASAREWHALKLYGASLGLAFQIKDDLLDIEGEASAVGKAVAKDADAGKATFVGLLGVEGARAELSRVTDAAIAALTTVFETRAAMLIALIDFNRGRNH